MEIVDRKAYEQPAVVYEANLEVRAGTGVDGGGVPGLNLFGD